jgi:aminobenzoyl-glutamate transport protein
MENKLSTAQTGEEPDSKRGFLSAIEKVGNKIPHTLSLFIGIIVIIMVISALFAGIGVSAVNPTTGELVAVKNLISIEGLVFILTKFISNFAAFPILGVTLVVGAGMGICEVSGMFTSVTKFVFSNVKQGYVALFIALFGVFMCSLDGAVSMVIVPTIAATIYLSMGKNPLIGVFSGFAAAATGAAMEFIPGFWQVVLTPLTISYAQMFDPSFHMPLMSDYYAVFLASVLAVIVNTLVTIKIIEPKFRDYEPPNGVKDKASKIDLSEEEREAVKAAGLGVLALFVLLVIVSLPQNSFMRGPTGSLVINAPLMSALENLLFLFFLVPGLIYARKTGQIHKMKDFADLAAEGIKSLLPFIIMAIVISQFIALFNFSNLGQVIAIKGGEGLMSMSLAPQLTLIILFLMYSGLDILIISGSTKFLLFGPIVVPMMMQMNIHPAFTQFVLRMADGSTNTISPFNPFLPMVLTLCMKYDKKSGIGTALSSLLPYALGNVVVFVTLILIWGFLKLPLGISGFNIWLH